METHSPALRERRASGADGPNPEAWQGLAGTARGDDEYSVEGHGRLFSVSRQVSGLPVERFLNAADGQERFLWRDGRQDITFAGTGVAAHMIGYGPTRFAAIQRQASHLFAHAESEDFAQTGVAAALAQPRLFGGFSFRDTFAPDVTWTGFHPAHFILPHYQLVTKGGENWLTINALLPAEEKASANLPLLSEALEIQINALRQSDANPETSRGNLNSRDRHQACKRVETDYPLSFVKWVQMIERAKRTFSASPLRKVVLSRMAQMRARRPFDMLLALSRLSALYPACYTFLFEPQPGHGFLGASPELLAKVSGTDFETMALAGSIQRGASPEEDAALASTLLSSAKERREHELVVDALRERLQPLTTRLNVAGEPGVMPLKNIQHLHTPVRAVLKRREGVLPLVSALHPTPAMGGTPREQALDFIREHEPTLRGWYAAPVGWIDSGMDGAFAVAIRSAVVQKERAWAYAGAGITLDSRPQDEWNETEWKFQPVVMTLVGDQP